MYALQLEFLSKCLGSALCDLGKCYDLGIGLTQVAFAVAMRDATGTDNSNTQLAAGIYRFCVLAFFKCVKICHNVFPPLRNNEQ